MKVSSVLYMPPVVSARELPARKKSVPFLANSKQSKLSLVSERARPPSKSYAPSLITSQNSTRKQSRVPSNSSRGENNNHQEPRYSVN